MEKRMAGIVVRGNGSTLSMLFAKAIPRAYVAHGLSLSNLPKIRQQGGECR